jgi:hypothetical protein
VTRRSHSLTATVEQTLASRPKPIISDSLSYEVEVEVNL